MRSHSILPSEDSKNFRISGLREPEICCGESTERSHRFLFQPQAVGLVGEGEKGEVGPAAGLGAEVEPIEQLHDAAGDGGRRVDDGDIVPRDDTFDERQEERIVGAPQDDLIGTGAQHGGDGPADARFGLGRRLAVGLDQLDEARTGHGDDLDALAIAGGGAAEQIAVETPLRSEHPHHPAAGGDAGGFHGRLHADDGHGCVFLAQQIDGGGRGSVACDDDHLAAPVDERGDGPVGEPGDLLPRARTIGTMLAVAEVDERLAGKRTVHLAPDGQPAQPGVVDAYGRIIQGER